MRTVDVCIPVYKPGAEFGKLLHRLCRQNYPIKTIRIINTQRDYFREELLEEPKAFGIPVVLEHISREEFDHGAIRNRMAQASEADLVLFMTQDAFPRDVWLIRRLAEAFENPKVASAYARQLPKPGCAPLEKQSRIFNYPADSFIKTMDDLENLGIKTYFCSNVCAMYRREVYEELGGFPFPTIFNEDMLYAHKVISAGFGIAYVAQAQVFHSHNYTLGQYFRRSFDMAVSQARHPEVFQKVSSEKEGMRLVREVVGRLFKQRSIGQIPAFFAQCAAKYAGYVLGKRYEKLPRGVVLYCSDNKSFWKKA
jgi:rhamnosyltransferase